ncbi:GNAT family N-acetyltransferase [Streptomyces sp. NPDC001652]|uniref:GNAT family N-acetyltransferase n=1 Tax=Streptomyces sp. NPDC001652 TaxID=3154393 RepID=UPI00331CE6DD
MKSTTIKRAVAPDADRLTGLIHNSGAYRDRTPRSSPATRSLPTTSPATRSSWPSIRPNGSRAFTPLLLEPPELDLAFVADDVQGKGIGRLLIEHMISQARAADLTEVRVGTAAPAPPIPNAVCQAARAAGGTTS